MAVISFDGIASEDIDRQAQLSFQLDGKLLKTYTIKDLKDWGAEIKRSSLETGYIANIEVWGLSEIGGTGRRVLQVEVKGGKIINFDLLNGEVYR